jgi:hypothetical protein
MTHVLPPDRRDRTSPSTPKRSKQVPEQTTITETYESEDENNVEDTSNRFSSLSHDNSDSEDEENYDDPQNSDIEEDEEVAGTNPNNHMEDDGSIEEPPQSVEAETMQNTKRPRDDDNNTSEMPTILVLKDLPDNFSMDDVELLLLGCNVDTTGITHLALTHDGQAICTFATPSLAGTALFRINGEVFNGYEVHGHLHVHPPPDDNHEPAQPPQIQNTAHAPGTTVETAMTIHEDPDDEDNAPFSQAYEQSLFFIRQVCPDSHRETLEKEINNNNDINELQALVRQWATDATKTLPRQP